MLSYSVQKSLVRKKVNEEKINNNAGHVFTKNNRQCNEGEQTKLIRYV